MIFLIIFHKLCFSLEKTFDIARVMQNENQIIGSIVLEKIYLKSNLKANFIDMPGRRVMEEMKSGKLFGEVHKIFQYGENSPNLIRIMPRINFVRINFFSKNKNIKITDWKSVSKYNIGIVKGIFNLEKLTSDMPHVTRVNSVQQLIQMNNSGRIDFFITDEIITLSILKKMKLSDKIKVLNNPLAKDVDLFHYINSDYKDIASKVQKTVHEMEKTGELEKLIKKTRTEFINKINE